MRSLPHSLATMGGEISLVNPNAHILAPYKNVLASPEEDGEGSIGSAKVHVEGPE